LPPWCRLAGHEFLGQLPQEDGAQGKRFFVRRGEAAKDAEELEGDKTKANDFEWRLRARSSGHLRSTVYCRNFQWDVGQAASFEERDAHPSAVEYLLGALAASLTTGFATECSRDGLEVDDVELTVRATLESVLAHLGLEEGEPALQTAKVRCFATSYDDEAAVRAAWDRTIARSPLVATLRRAAEIELKLVIL
jgi:hypothetical protein